MKARGFSLIELMVCLVVVAIGLSGGINLYARLLPQVRLISDTNHVIGLLALARNRAISHQNVLVCALNSDCTQFAQADGLKLVVDANHNGHHDAGDTLVSRLRLHDSRLSWHSFRNLPRLTYHASGLVYFQNGHLLLCGRHQARRIVINTIGRARVEKVSDFAAVCHR